MFLTHSLPTRRSSVQISVPFSVWLARLPCRSCGMDRWACVPSYVAASSTVKDCGICGTWTFQPRLKERFVSCCFYQGKNHVWKINTKLHRSYVVGTLHTILLKHCQFCFHALSILITEMELWRWIWIIYFTFSRAWYTQSDSALLLGGTWIPVAALLKLKSIVLFCSFVKLL